MAIVSNSRVFTSAINLVFLGYIGVISATSHANSFTLPTAVSKNVTPALKPRGEGTFRRIGFKVFEAKLWTVNTAKTHTPPYALQLKYARNIKAKRIVDASIKEMTKQKVAPVRLKKWRTELTRLIPNVKKGDVLTGVNTGTQSAFYYNGKFIGHVTDKAFGDDFFGIWLKENTSEPKLRRQLFK